MARIVAIELYELDLPFRHAFHHAAAGRNRSSSLFVRFVADSGHVGFGETLPRPYVTGEERGAAFDLLASRILPRILQREFDSFEAVRDFLVRCDGQAPPGWVDTGTPQSAAWCAVDLALLDCFARVFDRELGRGLGPGPDLAEARADGWPEHLRYSLVLSCESGRKTVSTLLKARLYGIRDAKVKVSGRSFDGVQWARRILGPHVRLRVDSNMAWTVAEARRAMTLLAGEGVVAFEQPLAAHDLEGMARLVAETGLPVIADESVHDAASLERVIAAGACTGVSVRIAKCGGLVAAAARCRRVLQAGLTLQVGCQVGETSQLSAAQLVLVGMVGAGVTAVEGCFGERLLDTDPVRPLLQFGRQGRPPVAPLGPGFGTEVDLSTIERHAGRRLSLTASDAVAAAIPQQQPRFRDLP